MVAAEPAQPAEAADPAGPAEPLRRTPLARPAGVAPARALERLAAAIAVVGGVVVLLTHPLMVDLEIPLRAAERWVHGGEPYLASGFSAP